ncbi:MAG: Pup--protein ligase, partial [Actinobacteria bacterium]|nr:Pup--protein ligase [Actinomycetota bacterium]
SETYRRLHVIVGDSNMSDHTNFLKLGTAAIMLRMLEHGTVNLRDLTLESPIRAIREISVDVSGRRPVRLANGREMSAFDIQSYLAEQAVDFEEKHGLPDEESAALRLWTETLEDIAQQNERLTRRIDWAIKQNLIRNYAESNDITLDSPRVQALDLQFHDIDPERGVFNKLRSRGMVDTLFTSDETERATGTAPLDTRAHLRGQFLRKAREAGRDVTVDWVHLKINDQAQRTVACKDPFRSSDERVDKLMESL